eukprot:TRINITY_DN75304_c0_g1_i1.p1 TRINITY_DN75304_c0_g1~~TRINITY_DN75304_c0_g1_i1.p1  ORF type:complete len:397 (+),score=59.23 TRINITY_DN75304_c0_g1_i1:172-1362(+)
MPQEGSEPFTARRELRGDRIAAWLSVARHEAEARWAVIKQSLRHHSPKMLALQSQALFEVGASPPRDSRALARLLAGHAAIAAPSAFVTAGQTTGATIMVYHKSGVNFNTLLLRLLAGQRFLLHADFNVTRVTGIGAVFGREVALPSSSSGLPGLAAPPANDSPLPWPVHLAVSPVDAWRGVAAKLVHWYRDPVALILSAYRYHRRFESLLSEMPAWHDWATTCCYCDKAALEGIFEACGYKCSYFDLLNSVDERTGVEIEALHSRKIIGQMQRRLAWDGVGQGVLHVTLEQLRVKPVDTMHCIFAFLSVDDGAAEALVNLLTERGVLQTSSRRAEASAKTMHATFDKYNNTELRQQLLRHPVWGAQFLAARAQAQPVFRQQAALVAHRCAGRDYA